MKWLRGYCCGRADGERGADLDWNVVVRGLNLSEGRDKTVMHCSED